MPTERLRFQSNYFKNFEMTGSVGYSSSDNKIPNFDEILNGFVTRSATRESTTAGPAKATRVSVNADWSGVYAVTDKFRIEDLFRYDNWRIPGMWATYETNIFGAAGYGAGRFGAAVLAVQPGVAADGGDVRDAVSRGALQPGRLPASHDEFRSRRDQRTQLPVPGTGSEIEHASRLQYDFTKRWSGRIGYLYTNRTIAQFSATFDTGETYFPGGTGASAANDFLAARGDCALVGGVCHRFAVLNADGSITEGSPTNLVPEAGNDTAFVVTTIKENALLVGFTGRPIDTLRITGDFIFGYNDNSFTRIDPRQMQSYKIHTTYTPKPWATLDGAVEIHENRDDVAL